MHFTKRTMNKSIPNKSIAQRTEQAQDGTKKRQYTNPRELHQKYLHLAKEATSAGNHVDAEQYMQHAEHYYRIVVERSAATHYGQQDLS